MEMGNIIHKHIQELAVKNNPRIITEFPLGLKIFREDLKILGSIDIVKFDFDKFDIEDIKTASQYTLPKNEDDKNPTYFDQMYIYAYFIKNYVFVHFMKLEKITIVYVNKHNLQTFKISEKYNPIKAEKIWDNYLLRVKKLHAHLTIKTLPKKEPNRWCKLCKYLPMCNEDVLSPDDIPSYSQEKLKEMFEEMTGKNAFWNSHETQNFKKWKIKFGY